MSSFKLDQLRYESDSWKRLLGFMIDENVHLKIRLSEILMEDFNNDILAVAEDFHNRSVKEDQVIGLLRIDIVELDKLLTRDQFEDGKISKAIEKKVKNLRDNIANAEGLFGKLKMEFNSYMSENIEVE